MEDHATNKALERGFAPGKPMDQYYSVEFSVSGCDFAYQFKIRDISFREKGVLVREDSDLLNHLKPGDILDLKYYTPNLSTQCLKTEIRQISKGAEGRFQGLCLVELSILENQNPNQ
ncbi:MAG: hypothetical protein HWN71_08245 [Desulfobacterales bacterium]|nr:hypothetical protein [Desulfobacterales bacterium]